MADTHYNQPVIAEEVVTQTPVVLNGQSYQSAMPRRQTATLRARADQEYVSGGQALWASANYLRTLSFSVDDVTAEFGDDLYDRMMLDGKVCSAVEQIIMSALEAGITVMPAVEPEIVDQKTGANTPHPDHEMAQRLASFIDRNLNNPKLNIAEALFDLGRGMAYGNKIAEKVFELRQEADDEQPLIYLRALKPKPRRTVAFVVDAFSNVVGIRGLIPGQGVNVLQTQSLVTSAKNVPNLLPRRKFCVFTWRPKSGDPRGTALLRPCYDAWWVKQQIKQERLKYAACFAGGMITGTTAEQADPKELRDEFGEILYDADGMPRTMSPAEVMTEAMMNLRNGSVAAFPFSSVVNVHYPPNQNPFDEMLDRQDREIDEAVSGQSRRGGEARFGSKADSETASDVHGLVEKQCEATFAAMLVMDIALQLIEDNWGEELLHLCPKISLSATAEQDFAAKATAVASLQTSGYFAPSQYQDVDRELGIRVRSDDEVKAAQEKQAALDEQAMNPPEPAVPGAVLTKPKGKSE